MKKYLILLTLLLGPSLHAAEQPASRFVDIGHARLNIVEWGGDHEDAEFIFALPGSGGDHSRYIRLAPLLADAGYRVVVINQRGIMGSTGTLEDLTLHDLAGDVIAVADKLGAGRFHMMGWAFGNRTSRMLATDFPDRVSSVTLIAAGGIVPALTVPGELGRLLGEADIPVLEKAALARRTLFSPAAPDELIQDYVTGLRYWPEGRRAQQQANRNTALELWVAGGKGPMLMVMGEDDLTAPVENGHIMKAEHGERLRLVIIPDAGHAVGLEKPAVTASAILDFLAEHPTGS